MTPFTIFLGDAKTMFLKGIDSNCFGSDPLDLTNCTEIDVALPNADGTTKHLLLSLGQVNIDGALNLGNFSVPISSAVSALLNVGQFQDFTVTFTILGEIVSTRFTGGISVFQ